MTKTWCRNLIAVGIIGSALAASTGCQTHIAGMTLPSGWYMDHKPQYFPAEPSFPLPRELATMQAQSQAVKEASTATAGQLPPPVNAVR